MSAFDDVYLERNQLASALDDVYLERNRLVAALSKVYPSHLMEHPKNSDWDPAWTTIVCVELPTGQATWHIHTREQHLFDHLKWKTNNWDGHTTAEKYERLAALPVSHE